ncbi:uncharacterized protein LOC133313994 [Gastrolobium bilobum]|uniref:uncharacterized protein LOC133313994 n=1 Tax=Gastrolobium bilobum TaxID=150636 RepID=UPI002AB15DEC|nr:uncharacterized protein LOC133313994 [Gastrolobium bilobum]
MASSSTFLTVLLFLLFTLFSLHVHATKKVVIPEDGFTVATVLDGHKVSIKPHSILQRPGSSDLIVLDFPNSAFYTVQFPISQESVFTRFCGTGSLGYSDGELGSAQFDRPKSFAVDLRGNVYVADIYNQVIRKVSANGVTTIAGGFSEKSSSKGGSAQNVSFSNNFDLTFIPGQCALLVLDHGHQLVHQINLKEEDCTFGSKSGLGAVMIWTLGLGLSCLLGLVIGIAIRPYIFRHKGSSPYHFIETWKHCLTSLGKLALTLYCGIKSAIASCSCSYVYTTLMRLWRLCLSHLVLMFRINIVSPRPHLKSVSLLDLDACNSGEITKSGKYYDQLKDLMSFDEHLVDSTNTTFNHGADVMIQSNTGFVEAHKDNNLHQGSSVCNLGIVKRR